jgi:hypothetical protein
MDFVMPKQRCRGVSEDLDRAGKAEKKIGMRCQELEASPAVHPKP